MLFALILVVFCTILLCWLLFKLAALALPVFAAAAAGHLAWQSGTGLMSTCLIGLGCGALTLFAGQFLLATVRSAIARGGLTLLFATPAAVAGYNAAYGLAALAGTGSVVQVLLSGFTGMAVALAAIRRLGVAVSASAAQDVDTAPNAAMSTVAL
jgi:hypothetical protein